MKRIDDDFHALDYTGMSYVTKCIIIDTECRVYNENWTICLTGKEKLQTKFGTFEGNGSEDDRLALAVLINLHMQQSSFDYKRGGHHTLNDSILLQIMKVINVFNRIHRFDIVELIKKETSIFFENIQGVGTIVPEYGTAAGYSHVYPDHVRVGTYQ